ncbi:hypothetical protein FBY35_6259 [Streptomyces sp. SLBN-118]|nr:hypothetical protein FBY35_6259 [Streptomyces sp. SLBN-118]
MGGRAVSGNHLPWPLPQGYGDTPSLPRAHSPSHGVPGSMPEPAPYGNAAWCLQQSGTPPVPPQGDRTAAVVVGTSVTPPPPGSFRVRTTARPGLRPLPGPAARTAPRAATGAGGAHRASRARPSPLVRVRRRRDPLGGLQLRARACRAGCVRDIRRRCRGRGPRPRGGDRRLPGAAAPVRAQCRPGARGRGRTTPRAPCAPRAEGAQERSARGGKCARRLTGSYTHTRMFSANFAPVASPWRNGLPTPLPPGKKGLFAALAPYAVGP